MLLSSVLGYILVSLSFAMASVVPQLKLELDLPKYDLVEFHKSLIDIDSTSETEHTLAYFLKDFLESNGMTVELQETNRGDRSPNVFLYYGDVRETKVLVTTHMDTVPPYKPYRREGNKIYGRGTSDLKLSIAAQVLLVLEMDLSEGDVLLLIVVGEESSAIGMQTANEIFTADGVLQKWESVIFSEPTDNYLALGHKGAWGLKISVQGISLHSAYPELGRDSNAILIDIMHLIEHANYPVNELLGKSTVNIGKISGGVLANVISDYLELRLSIRVAQDYDNITATISQIIEDTGFSQYITVDQVGSPPQYLDYDVEGFATKLFSYGTDIGYLKVGPQTKRYLYGPGSILQAHAADEYIEVDSLLQGLDDIKKLIAHCLKK